MKSYLNASETAKLLKVHRATITRWLKKGLLTGAMHINTSHQWRVPLSTYEEFVKNKNK